MSEMNLKADIARAEKARQVLKDPDVRRAIQGIRDKCYESIRKSKVDRIEEREDQYRMLRCADLFEKYFDDIIRDGKIAESKLEQLTRKVKNLVKG